MIPSFLHGGRALPAGRQARGWGGVVLCEGASVHISGYLPTYLAGCLSALEVIVLCVHVLSSATSPHTSISVCLSTALFVPPLCVRMYVCAYVCV
mmetsp:Transcript_17272/g.49043  ORF Transcript_17272/g.49043 Transcript_17272/m.49043 type:complete len:95 (+) Transcript_17272:71-355(+)